MHFKLFLVNSMHQIVGMWRSQPRSAFVSCGFHVQNPSDADLSRDQNYYQLL